MKVIYCEKGLANFYGDHIEINRAFSKNKKLRDYVVKHELGHSTKFDLAHEFKIDWKIIPSLVLFVFKNKSTWIDFAPIQKRGKEYIVDMNMLILYVVSVMILFGFLFLIIKIL